MAFRRDRLTWLAYALLAWYAYLQAVPGLVVPHLRDELHIGYSVGGLHVAAFAAGSIAASFTAGPWERSAGRRAVFWWSALVMALGAAGLVAGRTPVITVGSLFVAGWGGGILLITIQALLADHHAAFRAVALTEANVAASLSYVALAGALTIAAAIGFGWRAAVVASLAVPVAAFVSNRRVGIATPAASAARERGALGPAFPIAAAMLFCTTSAEWAIAAWGSSFAEDAAGVSADTGVTLMFGYFGGVMIGRAAGSRLARRYPEQRLLAIALAVAAAGFAILWPAGSAAQVALGLLVMGAGIGNLFPFALAVTVGLAPEHTQLASSRAIAVTSVAVLLAPLTIGALADATSITTALAVEPAALVLAAAGLTTLRLRVSLSRA